MKLKEKMLVIGLSVMIITSAAASLLHGKIPEEDKMIDINVSVTCKELAEDKGTDEILLPETKCTVPEGTLLFDIMENLLNEENISFEYTGDAYFKYVTGIGGIRQFDYGKMSGWYYTINGEAAWVGSSTYHPADGDVIEWVYSRDLENVLP